MGLSGRSLLRMMARSISTLKHKTPPRLRGMGDEAAAGLAGIGTMALGIAGTIVGAVVALSLVAALFPTYASSVGSISENVTDADWGDPTANTLGPVFAMLVSLGGLFAIIGLVFVGYKLRKSGA